MFPFKQVGIYAGEKKVTGSLRKAFEQHWGYHAARDFYHEQGLILFGDFNLVWWDDMERVMHYYSKMFQWVRYEADVGLCWHQPRACQMER